MDRPTAAPGRRPRAWRWGRLTQVERVDVYTRQSLYVLLWGMQAVFLVTTLARADDLLGLGVPLGAGAVLVGLAATRVMTRVFATYPDSLRVPWDVAWPLPPLVVAGALALLATPDEVRFGGAVLLYGPLAWALGGVRGRVEILGLLLVCAVLSGVLAASWWAGLYGVAVGGFFVFTVRASLWLLDIVLQLERARAAESELAVAEERLRFSRDVHDVLGRHLSTIALRSELAGRLAERGDPAAAPTMAEVGGLAHEALREARALARGYRETDLAREVEGARALLVSAGIDADLDTTGVPAVWHEAAGWVIREGVTNVLRHSAATRVSLTWSGEELVLRNDGIPPSGPVPRPGSGLTGLEERLAPLGGSVLTGRDDGDFVLTATLPRDPAGVSP